MKQDTITELKQFINGKTMVAEYCGNQAFQHLVKYTKIDLIFYAIVENLSGFTTIDPFEAFEAFKKFGLTHVSYKSYGDFKDFKELNKQIGKLYADVSKASIDDEEEGAVLYMVEKFKDTKKRSRTLTLCKLKTLEYRLFRKMREKLKNLYRKNAPRKNKIISKFKGESNQLLRCFKAAKELSYYSAILRFSMDFVIKNNLNSEIIHNNFVNFMNCMC